MKAKVKKIIIPLIIIVLIVLGLIFNREKEIPKIINTDQDQILSDIVVEIKGEVKYPGLYQISGESRIYDLVQIAGGFTAEADPDSVNLAAKIKDGTVIYVSGRRTYEKTKISLNNASLEELMTLTGIGEVKARNIIDYREKVGRFNALDELKNVQGISENLFEQIKEYLSL
ncbi:MAG TPA: hypothetical protein GX692_08110 [Acholeplasmataceae bacterium]|jgi:competence protein ComEA|nr:hypothetical protein [Acholeplasmataceae bacterium]